MEIGISSSCFYPKETETSFKKVVEMGAKTAEVFFNCEAELDGQTMKIIENIKNDNSIEIRSIHPFTSYAEPYILFGAYKRRIDEGIDFYKKYFEAAQRLGAECVVLHGGKAEVSDENMYFESFYRLCEAARPYGIIPAHEIVNNRSASNLEFLKKLKSEFKDDFKFVLDTKQCRRCGADEFELIRLFGSDIIQVHISDYNDEKDCITPGKGEYDFKKLFDELKKSGYDKSAIIELYNWGYKDDNEIEESKHFLENLL